MTEAILAGLDSPPDVIVAANDDMALGALQVVQEQGLDIAIIGFDALPEALASVRDGGLLATIEQMPGGQSAGAMQALVGFLRDGTQAGAGDPARAVRDHQGQPRQGRAPRRGELTHPAAARARGGPASRSPDDPARGHGGARPPRPGRRRGALCRAAVPRRC